MTFEDKKLSEFLALLLTAEQYEPAPPEQARHVFFQFIDLTKQVAELFKSVQKELRKNILLSDNQLQQDGVKKLYFEELVTGFAKYYKCYHWILKSAERTDYKDKSRKTVTLPKLETEISIEEIGELKWNIDKIEKFIETLNPQAAIEATHTKDKLSHKQQILLLKQLGFFELDFFQTLNETQKGLLVSHLLNRDEKNSEDNVRYVRGKKTSENTKKIFTEANKKAVNDLLIKVGLMDKLT